MKKTGTLLLIAASMLALTFGCSQHRDEPKEQDLFQIRALTDHRSKR